MPKQLNQQVNLSFNADISQAKKQLQDLQNSLNNLTKSTISGKNGLSISSDISKALTEVSKLKSALSSATTSTGTLDLSQFRAELNKAGIDAKKIGDTLATLGPEGNKAFAQLAQSVITAEVPLKRTNTLLHDFGTTLKNTAKWQISSSILHGFMGSLNSAYGYAQDLNESLNNIRIVTGQSTEDMAKFAKQANESAKALSTTTTAYTDAALIFYQQGLEGKEVTDRTDVVVKMANVTGESAENVSSYMTAIWNNFADGSESLEHYADVITALGASTASSSEEIAQGLEKFAAIGETVGLSYDYATSALATVVANTRQSADIVGTAFKTIFSRIQGLQLGETLEDGVDLNKYSKALNAVGVQVLDTSGEMRKLDDILDDLAGKWDVLSNAQQTALAQTVAGTRQYTQLVALMSNWDDMTTNLETAENANGSLQEQSDIYAEGWEAASKRVRASMQAIYQDILNDDFFIKILNGMADFLDGIDKVIEGLGGVQSLVPLLSSALIGLFNKDLSNGIDTFLYNLNIGTKKGQEELLKFRESFAEVMQIGSGGNFTDSTMLVAFSEQGKLQQAIIDKQKELVAKGKDFTQEQKLQNQLMTQMLANKADEYQKEAQTYEVLKKETQELEKQVKENLANAAKNNYKNTIPDNKKRINEINDDIKIANSTIDEHKEWRDNLKNSYAPGEIMSPEDENRLKAINEQIKEQRELIKSLKEEKQNLKNIDTFNKPDSVKNEIDFITRTQSAYEQCSALKERYISISLTQSETEAQEMLEGTVEVLREMSESFDGFNPTTKEEEKAINEMVAALEELKAAGTDMDKVDKAFLKLDDAVAKMGEVAINSIEGLREFINTLHNNGQITEENAEEFDQYINKLEATQKALVRTAEAQKGLNNLGEKTTEVVKGMEIGNRSFGESIVNVSQGISSIAFALQSLSNVAAILNDKELNFPERMLKSIIPLTMALPMLISGYKKLNETIGVSSSLFKVFKTHIEAANAAKAAGTTLSKLKVKSTIAETGATELETTALKKAKVAQDALNTSMLKNPVGLIIAALVVLVGSYMAVAKAQEKVIENQNELNEKGLEEAKSKQDEVNQNKELLKTYKDLYSQYKNNEIGKEDLWETTDKLVEIYKNENAYIAKLTGNYDELTEAVKRYEKEENAKLKKSALNQKQNAEDLMFGKNNLNNGFLGKANEVYFNTGAIQEESDNIAFKYLSDIKYDKKNTGRPGDPSFYAYVESTEDMVALYDQISEAYSKMGEEMSIQEKGSSEVYENTGKWLTEMQEAVESYRESIELLKDTDTAEIALDLGLDDAETFEVFSEKRDKLFKELQTKYPEEAEKLVEAYLKTLNNKFAETSLGLSELAEKMPKETEESLTEWYKKLPDDKKQILFSGKINFDGLQTKEELDAAIAAVQNDIDREELGVVVSLREKISSDKKLSKSEIKEALGEESILMDEHETEMWDFDNESQRDQLEILNDITNKKIEARQRYIFEAKKAAEEDKKVEELRKENLEEEQKKLKSKKISSRYGGEWTQEDEDRFSKLPELISKAEDKIKDLQDIVENGLNFEDFNNLVFENLIDGIDGIIDKTKVLSQFTEMVGENWTIASKNIETFALNFPEVMSAQENYKILQDGSVQLTKQGQDALKDSLEIEKQKLKAETEAYALEMQKQADIQQATADYYNYQADCLEEYLHGQATGVETEAKLSKGLNDYKARLTEITGEDNEELNKIMQKNANATNLNAEKNAEDIYNYWVTIGETMQKASMAYDLKEFNPPSFKGGGEHQVDTSSYNRKDTGAEDYINELDDEQIQNMVNSFREKAAVAQNEAATYLSKKVAAESSYSSFVNSANNAISGKGNGKSGSSSKDKKKETKDLKKFNDEFDRFYPVKKAIEDLTDAMSDLNKEREHMAGGAVADSLIKENKMLAQQTKNYEVLLKAQKEYQKELGDKLSASGMTFDKDGNISNYAEVAKQQLDNYNNAIAAYNASAQDEAAKDALKSAETSYNDFKNLLSKYQGVLKDVQGTQNEIDQARYKMIENHLKEFEMRIELKLDVQKAKRDMNNFLKDINQDFKAVYKTTKDWLSLFSTSKSNAKSFAKDLKTNITARDKVENIINNPNYDYNSTDAMFADRSAALEELVKLNQAIVDSGKELFSSYQDAWSDYLSAIDETIDQWDEILKGFDDIDSVLNHYQKIIELTLGEDSLKGRQSLEIVYKDQQSNEKNRQEVLNKEIDSLQKQLDKAKKDNNTQDIKKYQDAIDAANKNLQTSIENYLQAAMNEFTNSLEIIKEQAERSMFNGNSYDEVNEDWELKKKASEGYYDQVQRIYQLESLQSKWQKAINSTSNLKTQKELTSLMQQQAEALKAKTALSEKDIELAEKELQVYQAQIALEDAQNNKNSMKLTRDESGNWTYQYVADEGDIASKQEDLMAKTDQWRTAAIKASEDVTEAIAKSNEEYLSKAQALSIKYKNDQTKLKEEMSKLEEEYYGKNGIITKQLEEFNYFRSNSNKATYFETSQLYLSDAENYKLMSDEEKKLIEGIKNAGITTFGDLRRMAISQEEGVYPALIAAANNVNEESSAAWDSLAAKAIAVMASNPDSVKNIITQAYTDMEKAAEDWENKTSPYLTAVYEGFKNINTEIEKSIADVNEMVEKTKELEKYRKAVESIGATWEKNKNAIEAAAKKVEEYTAALAKAKSSTSFSGSTPSITSISGSANASTTSSATSDSNANNGGVTDTEKQKGNEGVYGMNIAYKNGAQAGQYDNLKREDFLKYLSFYDNVGAISFWKTVNGKKIGPYTFKSPEGNLKTWFNKTHSSFDTGGYTGDWNGGDGRLAMLHSKELVLNAKDTENMLSAVKAVRDISSIGNSVASSIANGISNMISKLLGLNPGNYNQNTNNTNSTIGGNTFEITMNVDGGDVNEIQQAILNLPNLASQYLSRNLK